MNNEVMVAISNRNYAGPGNMLDIWMDNVKAAGVKNAMVVALDSFTKEHVQSKNFPVIEMHEEARSPLSSLFCGHIMRPYYFLPPLHGQGL